MFFRRLFLNNKNRLHMLSWYDPLCAQGTTCFSIHTSLVSPFQRCLASQSCHVLLFTIRIIAIGFEHIYYKPGNGRFRSHHAICGQMKEHQQQLNIAWYVAISNIIFSNAKNKINTGRANESSQIWISIERKKDFLQLPWMPCRFASSDVISSLIFLLSL